MPALPQQMSGSAAVTARRRESRAASARGCVADALRVREVAGVVVRHPRGDRMARGARRGRARRATSVTSRTLRANARRARPTPGRPASSCAVVLHRRPAAGGVDDDAVDARALEASISAGRSPRLVGLAGVQRERAAAALGGGRDHLAALGREHAHRRLVHAPKNARCTQPVTRPTRIRASPDAAVCSGRCAQRSEPSARTVGASAASPAAARAASPHAGPAPAHERTDERQQRAAPAGAARRIRGYGSSEQQAPEQAFTEAPRVVRFDLRRASAR